MLACWVNISANNILKKVFLLFSHKIHFGMSSNEPLSVKMSNYFLGKIIKLNTLKCRLLLFLNQHSLRETHGCARLVTHKTAYDSQRTKRAIMPFAGNAGPDQPARTRRLIRAFVVRLQNQYIYTSPNRECPDQTARMRTVIWTFAVGIWHKGHFPSLSIICKMFAIALFVAYIGKSTKMSNKSNVSRLYSIF